ASSFTSASAGGAVRLELIATAPTEKPCWSLIRRIFFGPADAYLGSGIAIHSQRIGALAIFVTWERWLLASSLIECRTSEAAPEPGSIDSFCFVFVLNSVPSVAWRWNVNVSAQQAP